VEFADPATREDFRQIRGTAEEEVPLPLEDYNMSEQQAQILKNVDRAVAELANDIHPDADRAVQHKILQKTLAYLNGKYYLSYDWRYSPDVYIGVGSVREMMERHSYIDDVRFNPSGGCCSKPSNAMLGVKTQCGCQVCAYERWMERHQAAVAGLAAFQTRRGTGDDEGSPPPRIHPAPAATSYAVPRWGKLLVVVNAIPDDGRK
jgi:hypothetical protein